MGKIRLDRLVAERGLATSREKAQALILAGEISVDGRRIDKPGTNVPDAATLSVHSNRPQRVGRAGEKLEGALDAFRVSPGGRVAIDVGASIGGFTECLLRRGATCVVALDVGRGQLDWTLRNDPRVLPVEGVNARFLELEMLPALPAPIDLVVCDVSFISLRLVLPALARVLASGEAVVLVKPQFEAGRGKVGKGGVLRDPAERERVVREVAAAAVENGFTARAACLSPLPGAEGNREYFLHLSRKSPEGGTGGASGSYEPGFEESLAAAFAPAIETGNRTETP